MKVPFKNLGYQQQNISRVVKINKDEVTLKATLVKKAHHFVVLEGVLSGQIELVCDSCAKSYQYDLNEEVNLILTDLLYKNSQKDLDFEIDYDIIEFLDGNIDIDYIISSELNLIKCDYHKCKQCNKIN